MVYLKHTRSNEQYKVCLQFSFLIVGNRVQEELAINLQCNWNLPLAYDQFNYTWISLVDAKGLICINPLEITAPIAICNLFLGELKLLPLTASSPSNSSCQIRWREVAIGFDEDYKVVQLLSCHEHSYLHAQVYSKGTDSWRELADVVIDDVVIYSVNPIKSSCKNGYFAHWYAQGYNVGGDGVQKILSLDMKNEVLRVITLPEDYDYNYSISRPVFQIFAEDEHSFRFFDFPICGSDNLVGIYELRCEGSQLSWNHVMNVHVPLSVSEVPLCRTCVFFEHKSSVFLYDYSARKLISRHSVLDFEYDFGKLNCIDRIVGYKGSFVSL